MRVAHDKCGSLLVNTGELICMLKFSSDLSCQEQPLKRLNAMLNLQTHRRGALTSEKLKLRH